MIIQQNFYIQNTSVCKTPATIARIKTALILSFSKIVPIRSENKNQISLTWWLPDGLYLSVFLIPSLHDQWLLRLLKSNMYRKHQDEEEADGSNLSFFFPVQFFKRLNLNFWCFNILMELMRCFYDCVGTSWEYVLSSNEPSVYCIN